MTRIAEPLERIIADLPQRYPGPGGAVAVLRHGEVLVRHAWGWANAEQRIRFTPATLFRVCSITKQFTCAVTLELFPDPSVLDAEVRARLPGLAGAAPTALQLCHNQSGLRDYWAVAMLHGAPAESSFGDSEAEAVIRGTQSLHFAPGASYSYVNQNFRLLSDIVQARSGRGFAELLRTRVFDRAGMGSAQLVADTRAMPDGTEGYEGSDATGFRPAENRILWTGDAGMAASLDDMIAWERAIDAARDNFGAVYARMAAPVTFADGTPAAYGFGLARGEAFGRQVIGHGGGLRGWRSQRLYVPADRVSVVLMFNHLADAHTAAEKVLGAALGVPEPPQRAPYPSPPWLGRYLDPDTGLAARAELHDGQVRLHYGTHPDLLDVMQDGSAAQGPVRLRHAGDGLWLERAQENRRARLRPVPGEARPQGVAGSYRCAELDAVLTLVDAGGALYGAFSGFLGQGRMELLASAGRDIWLLPCRRALDYAPPGTWTLVVERDAAGAVQAVQVGCWLARKLRYERVSGG
jgi:D-aminopeptidase